MCKFYIFIGGDDYVVGPYSVVIPAGNTHVKFNVSIMDDTTVEPHQSIILMLSDSVPNTVMPTNPDRATVIIVDNDG